MKFLLNSGEKEIPIQVKRKLDGQFLFHEEGNETETILQFLSGREPLRTVMIDGERLEIGWYQDNQGEYHIQINGESYSFPLLDYYVEYFRKHQKHSGQKKGCLLNAPIPGRIVSIQVEVGQEVEKGQSLLVLSAMKMENVLNAPQGGKVKSIGVKPEQAVAKNQFLLEIE